MILLFENDFIDGPDKVRIEGRRFKHVMEVHRAKVGDTLAVGLLNDRLGTGCITSVGDHAVEMTIDLAKPAPSPLSVTLLIALPRPKVLRRLIKSCCIMGVKKIVLMNAFRVEKSFWQTPFLSEEHINSQFVLGLEQAKDTIMPEVAFETRFKPFIEDRLPQLITGTTPLLAHPRAPEPCPRRIRGAVTLAIGPEGGFIPYEIDSLLSSGFRLVNIGERILNVETAVPFLVSRVC